jgi:hypothetical protein
VVDIDDPLASHHADHIAQHRFAVLNRARAQVVAVEVEQVEREMK